MSTIPTSPESATDARKATLRTRRKRAAAGADGSRTKAWVGHDWSRGHSAVVWSETRGRARRAVAAELEIEYLEVDNLARLPELDDGLPEGMTLTQWQVANGWRWECHECGRMCSQDYAEPDGSHEGVALDASETVFCTQKCLEKSAEKWAREHAIDEAAAEDFKRMHPDKELDCVHHNEHGAFAHVKNGPMVTVWEFFGPREDYYHRRRILRELKEKAYAEASAE